MQPDQKVPRQQPKSPEPPPQRSSDGAAVPQQIAGPVPGNTQGLVGMALGIAAIPLLGFFYMGLPVGIVGAVLGLLGRRRADAGLATNRGAASAGLICGSIAVVLGVILVVLNVVLRSMDLNRYIVTG